MSNNDTILAASVAAISQAFLTLFGVDYYAMVWAFVGSCLALTQVPKMTRSRAIVYVVLSTLIGAALGSAAVAFLGSTQRVHLLVCSLVAGAGSQLIVAALLQVALNRIKSFGGANERPADTSR